MFDRTTYMREYMFEYAKKEREVSPEKNRDRVKKWKQAHKEEYLAKQREQYHKRKLKKLSLDKAGLDEAKK